MRGLDLTIDFLEENGFDRPILVETKDDLGLRVPPPNFKISDIERCVGMCVNLCIVCACTHVCIVCACTHVYMCMCMYTCVCVCVCTHVCMCMCMYTCVYVYVHVHMCVCVCACTHVCMCMCMYTCVYVYVHVHMCVCVCACTHVCMCKARENWVVNLLNGLFLPESNNLYLCSVTDHT